MNKAILIGRLVKDPVLKATQDNISVATFTIAVPRPYVQNGVKEADFINCVAWRNQADNLAKYCSKGSQVAIDGRIQVRHYDNENGEKKYVTEIICNSISFLNTKPQEQATTQTVANATPAAPSEPKPDPYAEFAQETGFVDYPF